jgi:ligand-binding SRPBCC domain-containing protein
VTLWFNHFVKFVKESIIKAAPERVFAFHELPDAINRLTPPWETARIVQAAPSLKVGERAIIAVKIFGLFEKKWIAEHTVYNPPHEFEDVQISGPFRSWRHRHVVLPHEDGAILRDEIHFEPPFGFLGRLAAPLAVLPKLEKMFQYRHEVTREWCESEI